MSYSKISFPKVEKMEVTSNPAPRFGVTEEMWVIDHFEHRMSVPHADLVNRTPDQIKGLLTAKVLNDFIDWISEHSEFFDVQYEYDILTGDYKVGTRAKIMRREK